MRLGSARASLADAGAGDLLPGHRARVLLDGREAYPAMLRAIDSAERTCRLETYIFADDRIGRTFARALAAKAREGVATALLVDAFGSLTLPESTFGYLRDAGVAVARYHASPWRFWDWNSRNHRKTLVVDGAVGFLGGLNISDEYAPREEGGGGWRDTHLRLEGPAVAMLTALFSAVWRRVTGEAPPGGDLPAPTPVAGGIAAKVIGTQRHGERSRLKHAYVEAIRAARRRVLITNAYFVPDRQVRRALADAVKRGVDVRVITAGVSDVPLVQLASRALYPGLLRAGVRLYERIERVLHAKTAVVDGRWSAIGSYNLNRRSLFHDLEVLAVMLDEEVGATLERAFDGDLLESIEVDMRAVRARPPGERMLGALLLRFVSIV